LEFCSIIKTQTVDIHLHHSKQEPTWTALFLGLCFWLSPPLNTVAHSKATTLQPTHTKWSRWEVVVVRGGKIWWHMDRNDHPEKFGEDSVNLFLSLLWSLLSLSSNPVFLWNYFILYFQPLDWSKGSQKHWTNYRRENNGRGSRSSF
jgi:hypothetical protein